MAVTPEEQKNARRKAMLLLEHMDRTEKGLSDRLRQAGFSAEATEDAMNYVRSYGYLNDHRYAMNYISFRMGTKSRQKILQELSGKGIDRETALAAWEEAAAHPWKAWNCFVSDVHPWTDHSVPFHYDRAFCTADQRKPFE